MAATDGSTLNLTLEQVRTTIVSLIAQGNANIFQIGRLYNYTVDSKLAVQSGYKDSAAYFRQHVKELSQATLSRYGAVAREFTEEACKQYGVENLVALLTYEVAAGIQATKGDPGPTPIEVPQEDGSVVQKPFAECSRDELRLAIKHKRAPKQASMPEGDAARVQALRESLTRHFAQAPLRFNARNHRGKTLFTLQDVSVTDIERLAEALLDGLLPLRAVG
jgi:hypothetical protein